MGSSRSVGILGSERAAAARGIGKSERSGCGAAAVANGSAGGRGETSGEKNVGGCGTRPAREFMPDTFFVEWKRVRIYCGHDWTGSCGALDCSGRTRCTGPDRVFEGFGEEREGKRWGAEFPVYGADGRDGLFGSSEIDGD